MITAAELTSMRDEAETLMPDEAVVLRAVETPDGQGGWTSAWATDGTYACNAAAGPYMRFGAERVAAGQVTPVGIIFLSLPHDADVNAGDRIAWTKAGAATATEMEVTQAGTRSWAINLRVACKEVGDAA
jgi:hypothetical protein